MHFRARKGPLSISVSKFQHNIRQRDSIQEFLHQGFVPSYSLSHSKLTGQDFKQALCSPLLQAAKLFANTFTHSPAWEKCRPQLTTSTMCENAFKKPSCWPVFHRQRVKVLLNTLRLPPCKISFFAKGTFPFLEWKHPMGRRPCPSSSTTPVLPSPRLWPNHSTGWTRPSPINKQTHPQLCLLFDSRYFGVFLNINTIYNYLIK